MKKLSKILFVICPLLFVGAGCEESSNSVDVTQEPLDISFVLLDSNMEEKSSFNENEEIHFAFSIKNRTDSDIPWYDYCEIFVNSETYSVYKLEYDEADNKITNLIGRPFKEPVNCADAPLMLTPGQSFYLNMPWSFDQDNQTLRSGQYLVDFKLNTLIGENQYSLSFNSAFTIN